MSGAGHDQVPDALSAIATIASEFVHALRNPISAMTTSVELLSLGGLDAEATSQLHRVMRNELIKMNDLLERCRELTHLTALARAEHDLAGVLRDLVQAYAQDASARGVALSLALPDEPVLARVDARQFALAVGALVTNALEAMPSGGALALALALAVEPGWARIEVRDTGVGIAPTALPNVFRLFYTTRKGAAGMGLPLARQVLAAHGGTVALESVQGQGTTALVRLPL